MNRRISVGIDEYRTRNDDWRSFGASFKYLNLSSVIAIHQSSIDMQLEPMNIEQGITIEEVLGNLFLTALDLILGF